jgi:hypothetical protein
MARFTGASGSGSGVPGPRGPEGDSAYDVAVANGFVGTEQEWLDSLGGGSDTHGDFYFDATILRVDSSDDMILEANEGDGTVAAQIKVGNGDIPIEIASYERDDNSFYEGDWATAEWQSDGNGGGQVVLTGITSIADFLNNGFNGEFQKITINNDFMYPYFGGSYGGGNATLYVSTGPEGGTPVTITTLTFTWSGKSGITIDYDDSEMNIIASNMELNIETTSNEDININSSDDLRLYAADDMSLRSDGYINFVSSADNNNYEWRMESNGTLEFPARGRLRNPASSSGDGNGYDTFHIIPDFSRYEYDQYLIVDPTQPNHIHVRAGGSPDRSNAELYLGAERTYVNVSDSVGTVNISSKIPDTTNTYENIEGDEPTIFSIAGDLSSIQPYGNFSVDVDGTLYQIDAVNYNSDAGVTSITASPATFILGNSYTIHESNGQNYWTFTNDGYLSGPGMGTLNVYGIANPSSDYPLYVNSNESLILNGANGEFLNNNSDSNNQIATIGDISNATPVETIFTINGGSLGDMPTFDGAPLFSGSYVKTGPLVHFQIQVDMDNILTFGSGQYYVDLPFDAKYGYDFREGCLHDISASRQYAISGHVFAGSNRLFLSYTDSNGQDAVFDYNSPVTLDIADNFHISGTYIID